MAVSPAKRPASAVYLLFVLTDVASATCPGGWTRFDEGGKCYKVTAGRFNALGCAAACGENASLACIRSSAEADFVGSLTRSAGDVWIGLYQSAGGAEPGGGWDTCASGEATNFTDWRDGFPSNVAFNAGPASLIRSKEIFRVGVAASAVVAFSAPAISVPLSAVAFVALAPFSAAVALSDATIWGVGQQCAAKTRAFLHDEWFDHPCYHPHQCLCELGASASAEYLSFIEADIQEGLQRLRWSVVLLYGIMIPACWILTPAFFICTVLAWSRLDCKTRALAAVGRQQVMLPGVATSGPVAPANTEAKLADAEAKGRQLRLRVSGTFVQLAWMLFVLAVGPTIGLFFGVDLTLIAGAQGFYNAALPWAIALLFLSLRPTDTRAITFTCIIIFAILLIATGIYFILAPAGGVGLILPFICASCAALVWPTLNVRLPQRRLAELTKLAKAEAEAKTNAENVAAEVMAAPEKAAAVEAKEDDCSAEYATRAEKQNTLDAGKLTEDQRKEIVKLQQKLALMQPRRKLKRLWRAFRLISVGFATLFLAFCINETLVDPFDDPIATQGTESNISISASWLIASLVLTPANRGRVVAWLGALGKSNTAENEAAAIAALVNNLSAEEAFKRGKELFRKLPFSRLTAEDLPGTSKVLGGSSNGMSAAAQPAKEFSKKTEKAILHEVFKRGKELFRKLPFSRLTAEDLPGTSKVLGGSSNGMSAAAQPTKELSDKTEKAILHEVDAFISHSWSDDGDAKYARMTEWAAGRDVSIWLDKACLDQRDIKTSLAGLPVFLAGCKQLLVLAGPTYASRLWCVMEIFVFVRMGGNREDMVVRLLSGATDLAPALQKFDAGKAKTFDPTDREMLWAVIEAAFGTFDPFNKIVRAMLTDKIQRGRSAHLASLQLPVSV